MKTSLLVLCVCFMALVSAPANAAGTIDVAVTGQTECFDAGGLVTDCTGTGQDGETQTGVRWPNPQFTDNGDGTITDNLTGMMWLKDANCIKTRYWVVDADGLFEDGYVYWQTALDFVNGINDGTYPLCAAGHTDWRLPNIHELKSLVDFGTYNPALPTGHPFETLLVPYWSSTTYSNGNPASRDAAWAIGFDNGQITNGPKAGTLKGIWPVRDSGAAGVVELPQTRQASCYDASGTARPCADTGEDAEFSAGVAWPNPRFTDNGDGTVTDELTGIIWFADVTDCMGGSGNWENALATVADLNADPATYHAIGVCDYTGTHDDWRLANIRELESIMHFDFTEEGAYGSTAAWLNDLGVGFKAIGLNHWTSTSNSDNKLEAWTANFTSIGQTFTWVKTNTYHIWPVRGGVYGDPDIGVTPLTIDFGEVAVGSSADRDITVTNEGTYYLALDTIAAPAAPFSITADGCSALDLYPGDSCTVTVHYEPTAEGAGSDDINVTSDDPDEPTVVVSLSGTGTVAAVAEPDISVTPLTIDFGNVLVGSSADRDITITNEGTQYLALDTIAAPAAPFSITGDGCSALDLYPGDSCTVTVHYEPTAEGAAGDGVNITSDDPDEATVAVSLSGTGTVAAAEAEPNNPPAAFDLVYPADGATGLSMPVTMIWKATTDPDGDPITYDVVYCEDNTFATCTPMTNIASVKRESRWMKFAKGWATALVTGPFSLMGCGGGGTTTPTDETPSVNADESSYQATDLNPGTTYYWKVTANDANGGATESAVWSFTTE